MALLPTHEKLDNGWKWHTINYTESFMAGNEYSVELRSPKGVELYIRIERRLVPGPYTNEKELIEAVLLGAGIELKKEEE